jgi:hypothetical protein
LWTQRKKSSRVLIYLLFRVINKKKTLKSSLGFADIYFLNIQTFRTCLRVEFLKCLSPPSWNFTILNFSADVYIKYFVHKKLQLNSYCDCVEVFICLRCFSVFLSDRKLFNTFSLFAFLPCTVESQCVWSFFSTCFDCHSHFFSRAILWKIHCFLRQTETWVVAL